MEIDETEGFLKIIEGRKEWRCGSSKAGMTYYTTNLVKHEADPRELQQLHARTKLTERQGSPGFPFSFFRPHLRRPTEEIEVPNTALLTDSIFVFYLTPIQAISHRPSAHPSLYTRCAMEVHSLRSPLLKRRFDLTISRRAPFLI